MRPGGLRCLGRGYRQHPAAIPTVMTFATPVMMKVMTVSLVPCPSPAHERREIRESQTRLSH
ncbi:MAG: hypothetical protein AW07_02020 [Candidatus Accumulibacter sp. SK-11]|nr:MAG: hypothetical protein AW07_02020 [Candidatus Accumulibacter sp. SK-11]